MYTFKGTKDKKELCRNCLTIFLKEGIPKKHQEKCWENETCVLKNPEEDSFAFEIFFEKTS